MHHFHASLTGNVRLRLFSRGKNARGLAHVVRALAGPRDLGGVLGGEDSDGHAVDHEITVAHLFARCNGRDAMEAMEAMDATAVIIVRSRHLM